MRRAVMLRAAAALCVAPWWAQGQEAAQGAAQEAVQGERLRFGLTAVILADQAAFLARWSAYLSRRVGARVDFAVRDSYQAILDLLLSGNLDAAWICGYPFVRLQEQLRLLAVPLYRGQPTYQAYLIRSRGLADDSAIRGWADLRGRVLAYSDPLSNSGWLVAQGQLAAVGITAGDLKRTFFTHGHRNVAEAVAARLAHAGAIDGYVWETMREQGLSAIGSTDVIWKSAPHGFPPLVCLAGVKRPTTERLQATLFAMDRDDEGRSLLGALNLDGFVGGSPSLFDSIRALARSVPGAGVGA